MLYDPIAYLHGGQTLHLVLREIIVEKAIDLFAHRDGILDARNGLTGQTNKKRHRWETVLLQIRDNRGVGAGGGAEG